MGQHTYKEIGSSVILFFLVFGMSATVKINKLWKQLHNRNALLTGVTLQFVILPFVGFIVVKFLNLDEPMGIALLVLTSSPGGSYSNWWCSMFNADLALSVTMTFISTLISLIMLPVNLVIYTTISYGSKAVVKSLDWYALFISLIVVIGGIVSGLICSAKISSVRFNLLANKLGNVAGITLIVYSILLSSEDHNASSQVWDQDVRFYFGVATPIIAGVVIATGMASYFKLQKPERVAVAIESCYQNTGIATSIAVTMFDDPDDLAIAVSIPLFYGVCEIVVLFIYCIITWKINWTKAPSNANFFTMITKSYEVCEYIEEDVDTSSNIEVVFSPDHKDLIFCSSTTATATTAIEGRDSNATTADNQKLDEENHHHSGSTTQFEIDETSLHVYLSDNENEDDVATNGKETVKVSIEDNIKGDDNNSNITNKQDKRAVKIDAKDDKQEDGKYNEEDLKYYSNDHKVNDTYASPGRKRTSSSSSYTPIGDLSPTSVVHHGDEDDNNYDGEHDRYNSTRSAGQKTKRKSASALAYRPIDLSPREMD